MKDMKAKGELSHVLQEERDATARQVRRIRKHWYQRLGKMIRPEVIRVPFHPSIRSRRFDVRTKTDGRGFPK